MAAEYKKPKDFVEAIAQYTGKPIENTPEERHKKLMKRIIITGLI